MSYDSLIPLINKKGSKLSPEEFQSKINIVFHDYEANHYDKIYEDMKESLQKQIDLLIDDLVKNNKFENRKMRLLDIGCGTGMSTQLILNSKIGQNIEEINLLDTSPNMLKYAEEKAKKWKIKYNLINTYSSELNEKFEIIIICSVLHHIPDLTSFLKKVDELLISGGILIHLQDPNGDFLAEKNYQNRLKLYTDFIDSQPKKKSLKNLIPKNIKNFIRRILGEKDYIDLINDSLLAQKVIRKRMSADELWSVTDIHLETKNNFINTGISLEFLKAQLQNFTLIKQRSYGFFAVLKSDLSGEFLIKENEFIKNNDATGRNISCVWIKK